MRKHWVYRPLWNDLENMRHNVGKIISDAVEAGRDDITCTEFPTIDVYEKDGELWIYAELSGMTKEDISLQFEDNVLSISGTVAREDEDGLRAIRTERYEGAFKRSIRASYPVDVEQITAEITNGLLTVSLPKHVSAKSKTIDISVQ